MNEGQLTKEVLFFSPSFLGKLFETRCLNYQNNTGMFKLLLQELMDTQLKNLPFYLKLQFQANTIVFSLTLHNIPKILFTGRLFIKKSSFSDRDTTMYLVISQNHGNKITKSEILLICFLQWWLNAYQHSTVGFTIQISITLYNCNPLRHMQTQILQKEANFSC